MKIISSNSDSIVMDGVLELFLLGCVVGCKFEFLGYCVFINKESLGDDFVVFIYFLVL